MMVKLLVLGGVRHCKELSNIKLQHNCAGKELTHWNSKLDRGCFPCRLHPVGQPVGQVFCGRYPGV